MGDLPTITLLANGSDPDGGTVAFVSVNSPSPNGGTLASDPATVVYTPAASFTADIDDVLVDIKCKDCDGSGLFKYSSRKIQWLKDKFKENYHEPNRCAKHKAIADAERSASSSESPPENATSPPSVPISPLPKVGSRFGSRRTPNSPGP